MQTRLFDREPPRLSSVLRDVFTVLPARAALLYAIAFVPTLVSSAATAAYDVRFASEPTSALGVGVFAALMTLLSIPAQWIAATTAVVVTRAARGEPVTLGECALAAFRRSGALVALGTITSVAMFGGFLLCCFPGLIAVAAFAPVTAVLMLEGLAPVEALRRSASLTRDRRLLSLGAVMLPSMPTVVLSIVATSLLHRQTPAYWTAEFLAAWLGAPIYAVSAVVLYHRLRSFKEGAADVEAVASVFD